MLDSSGLYSHRFGESTRACDSIASSYLFQHLSRQACQVLGNGAWCSGHENIELARVNDPVSIPINNPQGKCIDHGIEFSTVMSTKRDPIKLLLV